MNDKNPLNRIWNIFSQVSGVISLASLSGDIIAWKGFISNVVDSYRNLVDPVFGFVFSWFPFHVPRFVHDYFIIALIFSIGWMKSIESNDPNFWGDPAKVPFFPYRLFNLTVGRVIFILKNVIYFPMNFIVVWPIGFLIHRVGSSQEAAKQIGVETTGTYKWAAAILVGSILLFIVNLAIANW